MKVSVQWLLESLNLVIEPKTLADKLTHAGLEVDGLTPFELDTDKILVGKILQVTQKGSLAHCQLSTGSDTWSVVTQADVSQDQLWLFASPGAHLQGEIMDEKTIDGTLSQGMLCRWSDLGFGAYAQGVLCDAALTPGAAITDLFSAKDWILDVAIPPNRGDCLSIQGLSREVAALLGHSWRPNTLEPVTQKGSELLAKECPIFYSQCIRHVDVSKPSPPWLVARLLQSGITPINVVVDITNYVMIETGQPMHAYDFENIVGDLQVRMAKPEEAITLLNDKNYLLAPDTLVIADAQGAVGMAGIMGGQRTAVGDQTQHILLESAHFIPDAIRGRARRYQIATDASYRFERGVDPQRAHAAMVRAIQLLQELCGGEPESLMQFGGLPESAPSVVFDPERVKALIGLEIPFDTIKKILSDLGFVVDTASLPWSVAVPSHRFDITLAEDLVEEVVRVYGYDDLPNTTHHAPLYSASDAYAQEAKKHRLRYALADLGYFETIHFSFVHAEKQKDLSGHTPLALRNPLTEDFSQMRLSLWPGLLESVWHNQRRQQHRVRLFELGPVFYEQDGRTLETQQLAGVISGPFFPEQWSAAHRDTDPYDMKHDMMHLLQLSGRAQSLDWQTASHPWLHPGQSIQLHEQGRIMGWLGTLHPAQLKAWDLQGPVLLFCMDLSIFLQDSSTSYQAISKFPALRRDLSFFVPKDVLFGQIENKIHQIECDFLKELTIFDVYLGDSSTDDERKSMAIGLTLQHISRTLTDHDIEQYVTKVVQLLQQDLAMQLRDG